MSSEAVVVIDFGSQYSQLIARRIRECRVYCELVPADTPWAEVAALNPRGVILSGGPASVYEPGSPRAESYVFESGLPVLAICYGMQLLAHEQGGSVEPAAAREYGHAVVELIDDSPLFADLPRQFRVWMSHGDRIAVLPPGYRVLARSANSPVAAMGRDQLIGLQFHPEVVHTQFGKDILRNFLYRICDCHGDWTPGS
ncbi:MAG: glutamine-hydrolyzing GMP synthase, partial [Chloroflexi bacterium]|nr:glutamine-hydrolyzing GMP synthase [Chloroflexota bacterium]